MGRPNKEQLEEAKRLEENETVRDWLNQYLKTNTRGMMKGRLEKFLKWYNKPIEDLINENPKDIKSLMIDYQKELKLKGIPNNTILSDLSGIRALFSYLDKSIKFNRGQLVEKEKALNRHQFSNGDIRKIFEVGDLRDKAIISLASSLGWAISDVLAIDRKKLETILGRAKEENEQFAYYKADRIKTGAPSFGILNPLAIEWVSKWFEQWKGDTVIDIKQDMINNELGRLAIEAGLKTTGDVTFHCFRAWTFSGLIRSGLSDFEAKYCVGKAIPLEDDAYLYQLQDSIIEKYPNVYEKYFNFLENGNQKEVRAFKEETKQYRETIKILLDKIQSLEGQQQKTEGNVNLIMEDLKKQGTEITELQVYRGLDGDSERLKKLEKDIEELKKRASSPS